VTPGVAGVTAAALDAADSAEEEGKRKRREWNVSLFADTYFSLKKVFFFSLFNFPD
jgi:hypothetical protein